MSFGAVVVEKREGRYVRQVRVSLWFGLSTAALSPAPVWKATGHHPEYVSLSPFGMVVSWNWLKPEGPVKSLALKGVATAEPMIAVAKAVNGSVNILVVGCVSALVVCWTRSRARRLQTSTRNSRFFYTPWRGPPALPTPIWPKNPRLRRSFQSAGM